MQLAWRVDHTAHAVQLPVCVVPGVWGWLWNVGLHPESGAECEHLQRLCRVLPVRQHCED